MQDEYYQFEKRKRDHIELALMPANQSTELNAFDQLPLPHEALPDLNFDEVDISSQRFNQIITKPFFVSSMTAGHSQSIDINQRLMHACEQSGWAMGVGSQRRELTDKTASSEWTQLRKQAPNVHLFGNLGIAQLITNPVSEVQRLAEALEAKAMIIHCNPLQECIQPEGTPQFKGSLQALEQLVNLLTLPIIVKETGCGFSPNTLKQLNEIGVAAVDVSGLGGTHWGRIEGHRAKENSVHQIAAQTFSTWGINTIQSIINAQSINPSFELWGSGGVRHGLDAAKLFALGAKSVGFAKPMLEPALISTNAICTKMSTIEYELKTALFCTGSKNIPELREKICP